MPSLRLPIVINGEIDAALKRVASSTQIPVAVLARNAIIAMLAEHGEIIQNVPRPGGNRNIPPLAEIEPTKGKVEQDRASDTSTQQNRPAMPKLGQPMARSFSKAEQAGKPANGRRNVDVSDES